MRIHAIVIASLACGCAVNPDTAKRGERIVDGTLSPGDPAVVAISMRRSACDAAPSTPSCTGTLIHRRVVMTAAHCVEPEETGVAYEVLFGASNTAADAKLRLVAARIRHPSYDPKTHAYDVAFLRLADDAPVGPVAISTAPPTVGETIRVVGYGLTEDASVAPGTKRSGTMKITTVDATGFRAEPSPSNTCRADSGGPVFAGTPEALLGLTVSGDRDCREYAFNGRVDVLGPAIEAFVKETEEASKAPPLSSIGPTQICSTGCLNHASCPAGLECQSTSTGKRCVLPGVGAGTLGAVCGPGSGPCASGSSCVRVRSDGELACLCHTLCPEDATGETPTEVGGGGTCAMGRRPPPGAWLTFVAVLLHAARRLRMSIDTSSS